MKMINSLAAPARIFLYLALISIILYIVQSASGMGLGMGLMRTIIGKGLMIALWVYLLNLVSHSGGPSVAVAWALCLIPFMPVGLQFLF